MGGGGGFSGGGSSGSQWQQPKITPAPEPAEQKQHGPTIATNSDTNVPSDNVGGGGGAIQAGGEVRDFELPDKRDRCLIVPYETTLLAPNAAAIALTYVGQILDVVSRGHKIEVLNHLHQTCGVVIPKASRLIECIDKNYTFTAEVIAKDGAELRVYISNAVTP